MTSWITRGFDGFRAGTCGNAGHNLYVSRAGVLQRIFQYDLNGDGYFDLVLCNSQNHSERPPTYVYRDVFGAKTRVDLPSDSPLDGVVADLNGDGYDDLVLGMHDNGIRRDLNSIIYYGGPDGWSERRTQLLPTPLCTALAVGDIDGDGKPDLAAICEGKVRLFRQTELGFEPKRYTDLEITGERMTAADLDGDGCAELIVRAKDGSLTIYWGGPDGLDPARATAVPLEIRIEPKAVDPQEVFAEYVEDAPPLPRVLWLHGVPHLFAPAADAACLLPVRGREFGQPIVLPCDEPMAAAQGDVDGDGHPDLVFACRGDNSWVFWGGPDGFAGDRRTALPTERACDVAVDDLDGDECAEIAICQVADAERFDGTSPVFRGVRPGHVPDPVQLPCHDARRVHIARPAGVPEVVLVNHFAGCVLGNADIAIFWGGPDGFDPARRRPLPAWGAVECLSADLNDDGRPDLIIANAAENSVLRDPGSYVYLNGPDGFPDAPSLVLPTRHAHGVCCADLNRDGYLDLIFGGFSDPYITIFYGTAEGFDTANPVRIRLEKDGVVYQETRWHYLVDLNNDGWLDLVIPQITSDRSLLLWGGPDGFSMERSRFLAVERAVCARAADLTGNGYPDLIIAGHTPQLHGPHDTYACIYWNGPEGIREDNRCLLPVNAANAMAVADFNNDGLLDLFICAYHNGRERDIDAYLYWNRPGRGFSAADRTRLFTHSSSGALALDFNEDGWVDLTVANHKVDGDHIGFSAVWWNGPEGFSEARQTRLPSSGPHGITAVEPGNILDRGPEEYYTSVPYELPSGAAVTGITWDADLPAHTWVKAQLRCASTRGALEHASWSPWLDHGAVPPEPMCGWLQYRLALGAKHSLSSPRVREVAVAYG